MKTCVVIPTYNEAKAIAAVVKGIQAQGLEVIVVDDGSFDNTAGLAREAGAVVLENKFNAGKGASLIKGFDYALGRGFEQVITMDGDGQHLAADIPHFLNLAGSSQYAVIVGNRMSQTKNMPGVRRLTNKFMSWLISAISGQRIPDTQCGFRLIKKEVLQSVKLATAKYEIESELLLKAARLGFNIESVAISTVYNREKSQINPFVDTCRFIKYIIEELWMRQI